MIDLNLNSKNNFKMESKDNLDQVATNPPSPNQPIIISPTNGVVTGPPVSPVPESSPIINPVPDNHSAPNAGSPALYPLFASDGPSPKSSKFDRFKNKKFAVAGSVVLLVGLLAAGFIFGWYLPNRPKNVYSTGISRTGEVMERLVLDSVKVENLKVLENSSLDGAVDFKSDSSNFNAKFSSKYDVKSSDSSLDSSFSKSNEPEKKIGLKFLTNLPEGAYLPNIYFKLSGLAALSADEYYSGLEAYDDKWIAATSEYLQSFLPKEEGADTGNFSNQDAAELATMTAKKTREYLFSTDPNKAVLTQKSFVATEESEGLRANRYKVGINKTNAKKYCKELASEVLSSKAYKRLSGSGDEAIKEQKKSAETSCNESVDGIDNDSVFDLWVDKKRKLIHKVRFSDKADKNTYLEIGQLYKGGDKLPFFVNFKSDKDKYNGRFDLETDTKKNVTAGKLDIRQSGDGSYTLKVNFTFKPYTGEVKIEKPAGAIPIQEVLEKLGAGDLLSRSDNTASTSNNPADAERKSDIRALQSKLAEYYAINGFYPTLAQLNNADWRKANFTSSFPDAALKDPSGTSAVLAATSSTTQYSYSSTGCGASGSECQAFTLTATLSNGEKYSVDSL